MRVSSTFMPLLPSFLGEPVWWSWVFLLFARVRDERELVASAFLLSTLFVTSSWIRLALHVAFRPPRLLLLVVIFGRDVFAIFPRRCTSSLFHPPALGRLKTRIVADCDVILAMVLILKNS